MSLVRFGLENAIWFGCYSFFTTYVIAEQLIYSKYYIVTIMFQ